MSSLQPWRSTSSDLTPLKFAVLIESRNEFSAASLCARFWLPQLKNIRLKSSSSVRTGQSFNPSSYRRTFSCVR